MAVGIFQAVVILVWGLLSGDVTPPGREGTGYRWATGSPSRSEKLRGSRPHSWAEARGPGCCSSSWTSCGAWLCTVSSWTPRAGGSARPRRPSPTSSWTWRPWPRWSWPTTRYRGSPACWPVPRRSQAPAVPQSKSEGSVCLLQGHREMQEIGGNPEATLVLPQSMAYGGPRPSHLRALSLPCKQPPPWAVGSEKLSADISLCKSCRWRARPWTGWSQ